MLLRKKLGIVITDKKFLVSYKGNCIRSYEACVSRYKETNELVCAGYPLICINKAPLGIVSYPFIGGVISDYVEAQYMISTLIDNERKWYQSKPRCTVGIPSVTTEHERTALIQITNKWQCRTEYFAEVIAKYKGTENITVLYIAEKYIEICNVQKNVIQASDSWGMGIQDISPMCQSLCPNIMIRYNKLIAEALFQGTNCTVIGPHIQTGEPLEYVVQYRNLISVASSWFENISKNISAFIQEKGCQENVVLICDFNNIDNLAKLLSDSLRINVSPINNSLKKIANYLSKYETE